MNIAKSKSKRKRLNEALVEHGLNEDNHLIYLGNFQFILNGVLGTDISYSEYCSEMESVANLVIDICEYQTVRVMSHFSQSDHLGAYESDVYNLVKIKVKKSKNKSGKFPEQRMPNESEERKVDNFRYVIEIGTLSASAMLTPYGFIIDKPEYGGRLNQIDRSNLDEFLTRNLLPNTSVDNTCLSSAKDFETFKTSEEVLDRITKKQLIDLYNEMKDLLDDDESVSDFWISLTEKIAKDPANTEYTLWDLISEDEFVKSFLLSGHRQQETIIGRYSVVSRELEKINNKGNEWVKINYQFRMVFNKSDFSFVDMIRQIKKLDSNKHLKAVMDNNASFKKRKDQAPEHEILPNLAFDIWSGKGFVVNQMTVSEEAKQNFHNFVEFLETKQMQIIGQYYNDNTIEPDKMQSRMNLELIDNIFSYDVSKWTKKLKKLKNLINYKDRPELSGSQTKIDRIVNQEHGTNPWSLLAILLVSKFPNGSKMLKDKKNVHKILDLFFKTFFGDDHLVVSKDKFDVNCTVFEQYLTDQKDHGGMANSHQGRAELFLDKGKNQQFRDNYDEEFDGDSNKKFTDDTLEEIEDVTFMTKLVWWEDNHNGKPVACGYTNEGRCQDISAEHLENDTNKVRVLRHRGPNSAEGRIQKTIKTKSDWYKHMAEIQPNYLEQHGSERVVKQTQRALIDYAEYLEEQK
tara:strand:- start:224 stop:2284 length:2061 start_codon:yes stop_codon:yes gene_type:complete